MSIRPIDVKMAIPKTQEISKVEQDNQEKLKFSLELKTNEQNTKIDKQLTTVNDSEKLSKTKIKKEEKNKDGKKKNKKNQGQENDQELEEETNKLASPNLGTQIDIKI